MSEYTTVVLAALAAVVLIAAILYFAFHLRLERWKRDHTKEARRDAVQRSQAATLGKVYEHLIPYLPDFRWNPKDARFLGSPVDFLVFDGLSEGHVRAVVFVEIKTGTSSLNARERLVRDAVVGRRVEWHQLNLPDVRTSEPGEVRRSGV
jgi:predicted Holliday junction resolvase-like endonuclease